ncbi:hypothetical protein T09_1831 [Trichinella sp. T9]|nr:hypothetical protein T09_1831 [Trichinella sp. T9]
MKYTIVSVYAVYYVKHNLTTGNWIFKISILITVHNTPVPMDVEHHPVSAASNSINSLWFWSLCHPLRAINKGRDILVSPSFFQNGARFVAVFSTLRFGDKSSSSTVGGDIMSISLNDHPIIKWKGVNASVSLTSSPTNVNGPIANNGEQFNPNVTQLKRKIHDFLSYSMFLHNNLLTSLSPGSSRISRNIFEMSAWIPILNP